MTFKDLLTASVIYRFTNFIIQLSLHLLTCHSNTDKALFANVTANKRRKSLYVQKAPAAVLAISRMLVSGMLLIC